MQTARDLRHNKRVQFVHHKFHELGDGYEEPCHNLH